MKRPEKLADGFTERTARMGDDWGFPFAPGGPDRRDEAQEGHQAHHEVRGSAAAHQGRDTQAAADSKLGHGGEKAARLADFLGRHDVGNDAGVGRTRGVEEELDDRVTDEHLGVVVGEHQDDKAGQGENRAGDHDRPPPSKPAVKAIGPGSDQGRHRHRQQAADSEGDPDGRVLRALRHHGVDLVLDQDGGEGDPEEVASKPEGAESGVPEVAEPGCGASLYGGGRGHGRKASARRRKVRRVLAAAFGRLPLIRRRPFVAWRLLMGFLCR